MTTAPLLTADLLPHANDPPGRPRPRQNKSKTIQH